MSLAVDNQDENGSQLQKKKTTTRHQRLLFVVKGECVLAERENVRLFRLGSLEYLLITLAI